MRPTTDASRLPYLYTFAPEWPAEVPVDSRTRQRIDARLNRFRRRVDKANAILQMPTFGVAATEDLWLDGEIDIAEMLDNLDSLTTELGSNSPAAHLMYLDTHRDDIGALPPYMTSAAAYDGPTHRLILVLRSHDRYHCLVYDLHNRLIESEEEEDALLWLRVGAMQPEHVLVKAEDIIRLAEEALNQWATRHEVAL